MNPIIRLTSETTGYMSYMHDSGEHFYQVRIARLSRPPGSPTWTATRIYAVDNLNITSPIAGPMNRWWRDEVPVSFDLNHQASHLYLVYKHTDPLAAQDVVKLAHCDDSQGGCTLVSPNWVVHQFQNPVAERDLYQPGVAVQQCRFCRGVAVTFYSEDGAADPDTKIWPTGLFSRDAAVSWTGPFNLKPGASYEPCPSPTGTQQSASSIGDYFQSVYVDNLAYGNDPWIVSLFFRNTDGCQSLNELTYDHHVEASVW